MPMPYGMRRRSEHPRNLLGPHEGPLTPFINRRQGGVGMGTVTLQILDPAADDANRVSHEVCGLPVLHHLVLDGILLVIEAHAYKVRRINVCIGCRRPVHAETEFTVKEVDITEPEGGQPCITAALVIFSRA